MFSLFERGIKDTKCSKIVGLPELIQIIRNNPNNQKIETIRNLRKNGDEFYKELKSELPNITPNCIVKVRNLEEDHFDQNFMQYSQYLYFDIDKWNAEDYKSYFINKYGHLASLICISSSGGGISVLFRVKNTITKENFPEIWQTVRDTILFAEPVDEKCKDIGRAMFISHDPSVFFNYENQIEVEIKNSSLKSDKKRGKQSKTCKDFNNRLTSPFSIKSIDQILKKLANRTSVEVLNPIVDFKPVEYVEVYIPAIIKDGIKHVIYTSMIHALVYLNPSIESEYIFSFMWYVNNRFAKPKMEKREFIRLFNLVYNGIKETGRTKVTKELKFIHFHPDCKLTKEEKINISNMLNGYKRKNESIQKIIDAKNELKQLGQKMTQKRIAAIAGLSAKTVRTHLNSPMTDMDEMVQIVNDSIPGKE